MECPGPVPCHSARTATRTGRPRCRHADCDGTPCLATVPDDLGTIRFVFGDACRTIAADAWDARRRRRRWGITYLDPKTV